jgi:seryl-tRNA synthetase
MLDLKFIRENPELVKAGAEKKQAEVALDRILGLDVRRRQLVSESDSLKQCRNEASKEIGQRIKAGQDPAALREEMRALGEKIKGYDEELRQIDNDLHALLLTVPNLPHPTVPVGTGEADNRFVREWGARPTFDFTPRPHWEIGEMLGILDFQRATKICGSNFAMFKGMGARLERALINFMLDLHINEHGYTEIWPPFMVNRKSMTGTGQLPKLEEDMYLIEQEDLFLNPTAEVPITNLHQDEILNGLELPIYYVSYTACFRREAGSYGKETRGLTRIHQFDKVEMVKFVTPESSYEELEGLLKNAEDVLQRLGIPYRIMELCSAEISFAASKCYDIEAWAPGMNKYLEVSSCSNFEDFQARRAGIRFRRQEGSRPEYVHTLNASGVALPRTVIALIENHQQADGSVRVPEVLHPYLHTDSISPP